MFDISHNVFVLIAMKSIGIGFLLGCLYGVFSFVKPKYYSFHRMTVLCDIVFCVIAGIVSFLFMLEVNYGRVRVFIIAGEFLGFMLYFSMPAFLVQNVKEILRKPIVSRNGKNKLNNFEKN